jgi:hypothetical protein
MKVIIFAKILVNRGNLSLAVTIVHDSYLFENLMKNSQ